MITNCTVHHHHRSRRHSRPPRSSSFHPCLVPLLTFLKAGKRPGPGLVSWQLKLNLGVTCVCSLCLLVCIIFTRVPHSFINRLLICFEDKVSECECVWVFASPLSPAVLVPSNIQCKTVRINVKSMDGWRGTWSLC